MYVCVLCPNACQMAMGINKAYVTLIALAPHIVHKIPEGFL